MIKRPFIAITLILGTAGAADAYSRAITINNDWTAWVKDGLFFYSNNETVPDQAAGAYMYSSAYFWFRNGYAVSVGFLQYSTQGWWWVDHHRKNVYEIYDQSGDIIYIAPGDFATQWWSAAGLWYNSGVSWHFNWWTNSGSWGADRNNINGDIQVYWDQYGNHFQNVEPWSFDVGARAWGSCQNYFAQGRAMSESNVLWRDYSSKAWYTFGSMWNYRDPFFSMIDPTGANGREFSIWTAGSGCP